MMANPIVPPATAAKGRTILRLNPSCGPVVGDVVPVEDEVEVLCTVTAAIVVLVGMVGVRPEASGGAAVG